MNELSIKINDIPEDGENLDIAFSRALLADALEGVDVELAASQVTAHMHLARVGDTISINGSLEGHLKSQCARCLGEAIVTVHSPLKIIVGPEDLGAEESVEDEMEYFVHDGERVELQHILREALIFTVPMSIVCRESCQGLCIVCGGDLNLVHCGHSQAIPDPRLLALKDIKLDT